MTRPAPLAPGLVAAAVLARQGALVMDGEAHGPTAGPHALRAHAEDCIRIATREAADDAGDDDACAREALRDRLCEAAAANAGWGDEWMSRRAAWATVLALLLGAVLAVVPARAGAQSDETLLLRSCVSERGWAVETDDCVIVAEVVRARMERRGGTFAQNIRALAPRLHGGRLTRRRWLADLDTDCHRPRGWPDLPWSGERGREDECLATVAEVRAILAGERVSPCVERPHHWGSRADVARRVAAGFRWRDARCPGAVLLNRAGFLYRPAEVDRD